MKAIDPNYQAPPNEFKQWPDGDYTFKGFKWTSLSNGQPCLKAQKDGRMTGRLNWILPDGKEGPYQGLELSDMAMLRRVLGLPQARVPAEHEAGAIASFMKELEAASHNKPVEAKISKNWVNIKGMEVPAGYYRFYLSKVGPVKNGVITPHLGDYGLCFFAEFTIESGEGGSPTPFKGASFSEIVPYAIEVTDGEPHWKTKDGAPTGEATRLSLLMRLTAPEWMASDMPHKDHYNLLPEWAAQALSAKKLLRGSRGENKNKRLCLLWATFEAAYDYQEAPPTPAIPAPSQNGAELNTAKDILSHVLSELAGKPAVIDLALTPAGKELALKYFKPLKEANKIVNTAYASLTDEEVLTILEVITFENMQFSEEYSKANRLVHGIIIDKDAGPGPWEKQPEEEDNPFK